MKNTISLVRTTRAAELIIIIAVMIVIASMPVFAYLRIHPDNPHYFQESTTGQAVMITSYGTVAPSSTAIDYVSEINSHSGQGMQYVRIWHMLPWELGNAIWMWNRSGTSGAYMGGNKFDLNTWNSTYWSRLNDCVSRCNSGGMYTEIMLFDRCSMSPASWDRWGNNPWASDNNINSIEVPGGASDGTPDFYYYSSKTNLRTQQERYLRYMIDQTIDDPNVIYEVENEHWEDTSSTFGSHYAQFVKDYINANYPGSPRLVSYNSLEGDLHDFYTISYVDVVNKHYDDVLDGNPDLANQYLEAEWGHNKAMSIDEFANGLTSAGTLRQECWTIITSGGNFHVEDADAAANPYNCAQNINAFKSQSGWDFIHSAPQKSLITSGGGYCMRQTGVEYVCYFPSGGSKTVNIAAGNYRSRWWDPRNSGYSGEQNFTHGGGGKSFSTPDGNDWVLHIGPQAAPQTPYAGVIPIPGTIEVENFDNGGEGVAYHDGGAGNAGGAYRSTDVDIETTGDTSGVYNVGWIDAGEWLEYTVNVASSGDYSLKMRVASPNTGSRFRVKLDNNDITGARALENTGGWQTYTNIIIPARYMAAGQHILQVYVDSGGWNFNYIDVVSNGSDAVSCDLGNIEVLDGMTHIQNSDGDTVAWTAAAHDCRENVDFDDTYMYFGVSDAYAYQGSKSDAYVTIDYYDHGANTLVLQYDAAGSSYQSVAGPALTNTNTWKQYTWHVTDAYFGNRQNNGADFRIAITGGQEWGIDTVTVQAQAGGGQSPYSGVIQLPGTAQAENFDNGGEGVAYHDLSGGNTGGAYRSTDVDIETTGDTGGVYNVGWIDTGEWLEYTVNVASAGTYTFNVRAASPNDGSAFHIEMNGQNVTGSQTIPNTGGWQTYTTKAVTGVSLSAGQQVMRFAVDGGGFNLNYIELETGGGPVTISNSAFDSDLNGWTASTWRASTQYSYGTMGWVSGSGNPGGGVRCAGSGATDNTDRCNREGGEIKKNISTAGYSNISVQYDLDVNALGNNMTGAGIGSCTVDHSLIDEQLTVFYSTNGGSSWSEAEYITRATLLANYQNWGTRTISLSGVSACNNNANFWVRFRWQVNSTADQANLDNIKVISN